MLAQNIHMPIIKGVSTLWNSTVVTSYLFGSTFWGSAVLPSFFLSNPETVFASLLLTPEKREKLIRAHPFFLFFFEVLMLYLWGLYFFRDFFCERKNYERKQMVLNLFTCFLPLFTSLCCLTGKKPGIFRFLFEDFLQTFFSTKLVRISFSFFFLIYKEK